MTPAFREALKRILAYEGGFVDHPKDPGGATNKGITQATYARWLADQGREPRSVRDITDAEVETIYHERYWLKCGCDQMPPALAFVVFDSAVQHGAGRALEWLANITDWRAYLAHRILFYANLETFTTFGRGWMRRAAATLRYAAELDTAPAVRQVLVFNGQQHQIAAVPVTTGEDVLIRVTGAKVFVRPDKP